MCGHLVSFYSLTPLRLLRIFQSAYFEHSFWFLNILFLVRLVDESIELLFACLDLVLLHCDIVSLSWIDIIELCLSFFVVKDCFDFFFLLFLHIEIF